MNSIWKDKLYMGFSIIVLIIIWKILSNVVGWDIILPSPDITLENLVKILSSDGFFVIVGNTILKSLVGFLMAIFFATVIGIMAGIFNPIYYLFSPVANTIKAAPSISLILLALIWLGSDKTPVLVGFLVIFPILYSNIVEGIKNVDDELIEMAKVYKVPRLRVLRELYLPSIFSYFMAGASTAIGLNLKVVIAAEVLSQSMNSIGESMQLEKYYLNTAGVFAWTIIAIITASILEIILNTLHKRIEKWK